MKKRLTRTVAVLTLLCICFSLAACGGGNKPAAGTEAAAKEPENEYIYEAQYTTLRKDSEDLSLPMLVSGEGFFAYRMEKVGEREHEGKTAEYEGQFDISEPRLCYYDFEGRVAELSAYAPAKTDISAEGKRDFVSSVQLNGLAICDESSIYALETVFSSWSEAPENMKESDTQYGEYYKSRAEYYLRKLDSKTGMELTCAKLQLDDSGEVYFDGALLCDDSGNLVANLGSSICAFAPDGSKSYEIGGDLYVYSLVRLPDGKLGALTMDTKNYSFTMRLIDSQKGQLEETRYTVSNDAYELISGGGDYDFYYTSGINFYGYSMERETADKLFNWANSNVDSSSLIITGVKADGGIFAISCKDNMVKRQIDLEYISMEKTPYDAAAQKETLRLVGIYVDESLQRAVIDFNRKSETCRIEIEDYSEYNTEDDYSAGYTKLSTEIIAGNIPDLIYMAQDTLPYSQLAGKGLLENLYPYIDSDPDMSRTDFFPNIFRALEVDGGLYTAPSGFSVLTFAGSASVVGEEPGWTYDEYYEALAKMPEGCEGFDVGYDRNTLLSICLSLDMDKYVDWKSGKCNFDSEEFIEMLKFANHVPHDFDYDNYEYSDEDSASVRIAAGKQMLGIVNFSSTDYFYSDLQLLFGEDAVAKGIPCSEGVGNILYIGDSCVMSSACKNKDEAWKFLRKLLLPEYQESIYYLPTNIKVFEDKIAKATVQEYETDPNGNYILDANGEKIRKSKGKVSDGISTYDIYAPTPEQAEQLREIIEVTDKMFSMDTDISDIVIKEVQAYFAGQKTAEEVAKLIQSKVSLYVNEQR